MLITISVHIPIYTLMEKKAIIMIVMAMWKMTNERLTIFSPYQVFRLVFLCRKHGEMWHVETAIHEHLVYRCNET